MVTRKPVPHTSNPDSKMDSSPPYPISPVATNRPSNFPVEYNDDTIPSATDAEPNPTDIWNEGRHNNSDGIFQGHSHVDPSNLPNSLKVGPTSFTPKTSQEALKPKSSITNPFILRRQQSQSASSSDGKGSSAEAWRGTEELPSQPSQPPPPIPQLAEQFSNMDVSGHSTNPWQPVSHEKHTLQASQIQREVSDNETRATSQVAQTVTPPELSDPSQQPVLVDIEGPESPAWDEEEDDSNSSDKSVQPTLENQQILEDRHAWDAAESQGPRQDKPVTYQNPGQQDVTNHTEGWNLIDHEPTPQTAQQSGIVGADGSVISTTPDEDTRPALPPRKTQEQSSSQPPRPIVDTINRSSSSLQAPGTPIARKQKKETYEIKKITWHDINAQHNPRISPILVQNANGPCPLLALVNALTLSTPADVETALVETLRSRERVSLGLLLDAVFDELMSGRRGDAAQALPDVSDLYTFLLTLHTGMNVNPLFVSSPAPTETKNRNSLTMPHIHPTERAGATPGLFEETREMKLYSTFSIPLIHGWIPETESPAYIALSRSAKSYEDAQNLMFHEEELEDKLAREGLSFEEQATLEDIATIKAFFISAATQLTYHGLDIITKSLEPGGVAILFRNDHFSTLYRHPNGMLLQLVTDSGYAGHEEVVWEGLIDVNGERAEFFSGDFRIVSGASTTAPEAADDTTGWTTVTGRRNNNQAGNSSYGAADTLSNDLQHGDDPKSPRTEQEDHDFALALQLQEEEDERQRNEVARRRRETELSQQYIEQQGNDNNIPVTQRGGSGSGNGRGAGTGTATGIVRGLPGPGRGTNQGNQGRPAVPPRRSNVTTSNSRPVDPEAGVDAPPPTYEEAATESAYHPPANHPSHPTADPNARRRTSAYTATSSQFSSQSNSPAASARRNTGSFMGRGRPATLIDQIRSQQSSNQSVTGQNQRQDRDKDCIVM